MKGLRLRSVAAALAGVSLTGLAAPLVSEARAQDSARRNFNIPAQPMAGALETFGRQSGRDIMFDRGQVANLRSNAVRGSLEPGEALRRLVGGSGLSVSAPNAATFVVGRGTGEAVAGSAPAEDESADQTGVSEILVVGSRSQNADIRRTENDALPRVIFTQREIAASSATSTEEFIRNNVSMSTTQSFGPRQSGTSSIGLRGLDADETLVLINGRRVATPALGTSQTSQTDLNAIPLSAIERIEILPTTASGIYGGNATGGVINVILRQDYHGLSITGTYGNTFEGGGETARIDVLGGLRLGPRTNVTFSGTREYIEEIRVDDRDFVTRARQIFLRNNPAALNVFGVVPPGGTATNYISANNTPLFGPGTPTFGTVPAGYTGGGGIAGLLPGAGHYNLEINDSASFSTAGGAYILESRINRIAGRLNMTHELTDWLRLFGEVSYSETEATFSGGPDPFFQLQAGDPGNPFNQSVIVTVPTSSVNYLTTQTTELTSFTFGATARLSPSWAISSDFNHSESRITTIQIPTAFTPSLTTDIRSGAINVFRDVQLFPVNFAPYARPASVSTPFVNKSDDLVFRLGGPLFRLPGGNAVLNALGEYRREAFEGSTNVAFFGTSITPPRSQSIYSAYGELTLPVFGRQSVDSIAWELQLAGRYDRYRTSAGVISSGQTVTATQELSSFNPTIASRIWIGRSFILRASYGTGFLPPVGSNLVPIVSTSPQTFADPRRGNELVTVPAGSSISGGNPDLRPESSKAWSVGLIITPRAIPGLRVSADFTSIHKKDNIAFISTADLLANEESFPGRVVRAAPAPGDPFSVGRITRIDVSQVNFATVNSDSLDVSLTYDREVWGGELHFGVTGTLQTRYAIQLLPNAPVLDALGQDRLFAPLRLRGNAYLGWDGHGFRVRWSTRYLGRYDFSMAGFIANTGTDYAKSNGGTFDAGDRLYHDFSASISLRNLLRTPAELSVNIANVFNTGPRFDPVRSPYYISYYDDIRLRSIRVSLRFDL